MDADFWHDRWAKNQIGFHEGEVNARLVGHFGALGLAAGARVFVPLCGKTRDIAWLLAQGHPVAGAELSRLAVEQLFAELGVRPVVEPAGPLVKLSAPGVDIFVGDIFDLTPEVLGGVAAVYDRAALVALPYDLRSRYAAHTRLITAGAPQLVICFDYDQALVPGPPFSVDAAEVARVHSAFAARTLLDARPIQGLMKGVAPATESVWLLT